MEYGKEKKDITTLRIQDFTPFIGAFFYQARNWRDAEENGYSEPTPYNEYVSTSQLLLIINVLSGGLILKGLESLLN